jgi:hypothetical protein
MMPHVGCAVELSIRWSCVPVRFFPSTRNAGVFLDINARKCFSRGYSRSGMAASPFGPCVMMGMVDKVERLRGLLGALSPDAARLGWCRRTISRPRRVRSTLQSSRLRRFNPSRDFDNLVEHVTLEGGSPHGRNPDGRSHRRADRECQGSALQ